jgi:hypothetical protein
VKSFPKVKSHELARRNARVARASAVVGKPHWQPGDAF